VRELVPTNLVPKFHGVKPHTQHIDLHSSVIWAQDPPLFQRLGHSPTWAGTMVKHLLKTRKTKVSDTCDAIFRKHSWT
jgi:hypothetical protein